MRLNVEIHQQCDGDGELELTLLAYSERTPIGPESRPLALDLAELRVSSYATGLMPLLFDPASGSTTWVRVNHEGAEIVWSFAIGKSPLELRFEAKAYQDTLAKVEEQVGYFRSSEGLSWRSVELKRPR